MATRYLIMLAADAVSLVPTKRFRNMVLRLGRPLIERSGVVSRRVLWAHDFPEHWPNGTRTVSFDDEDIPMQLTSTFPSNWRDVLNQP